MSASSVANYEMQMTERLCSLRFDPLGAILYGFPWGEGALAASNGPWSWARELLNDVGAHLQNPESRYMPGRFARSSGHGIGKSATVGQIIWWGMSCFEDCRVVVTANTKTQLETKTQPEVAKWFRMAINADDFEVNVASIKIHERERDRNWRTDFIPWSEDNPQAFAGLHNAGKIIIVICDEASEISDVIFEVIAGALTDLNTIILFFQFGNPTRREGHFYQSVFGTLQHRWNSKTIDAREVEGTNKAEIQAAIEDFGEDSDFVRVRYLGLPPRAGSSQFIDHDLIVGAMRRPARCLPDDPLIAGCDLAWGGEDDNYVSFRKGNDARSIPPVTVKGEFTRDPSVMIHKLTGILDREYEIGGRREKVRMLFLDSAGIAGPIAARLRQLGYQNVVEVNFGGFSPDAKCAFMRDCMWQRMKDWLANGSIIQDPKLEAELSAPSVVPDKLQRVKLLPKERMRALGLRSPSWADSLALTWAIPVQPKKPVDAGPPPRIGVWS